MTQVLLLHCDGADASTTFTDSSGQGHNGTAHANAQLDTAQQKFGTASLLLDGTGDYIDFDGSSDFVFGTGDFTVDFWLRLNATGIVHNIFNWFNGGDSLYILNTDDKIRFFSSIGGNAITTSTALVANTWYHIAFTRASASARIFINGTQEGSTYTDSNNYSTIYTNGPRFGDNEDATGTQNTNGWYDEIRVLKGEAAWTSNFTPPTSAYGAAAAPFFNMPMLGM